VKRTSIVLASLLIAVSACGGGSDNGNPTGVNGNSTVAGDGSVTMTINGAAWRSLKAGDRVTKNGQLYGIASVNVPYALVLVLANVTGPGTFSLSAANASGSNAIISNTTGGWGTGFAGGTGTATVTVLTANRIAGTFSFDAKPGSGGATGTMQIRNGKFDLTF
jgi:uncharacterized protein DUF6252